MGKASPGLRNGRCGIDGSHGRDCLSHLRDERGLRSGERAGPNAARGAAIHAPGVARSDASDVYDALRAQGAADLAAVALAEERSGADALDAAGAIHEALGVRFLRAALFE